jgi:transposase
MRAFRLFGERGEDWTFSFPHLVEAMSLPPAKSCIVDGGLVTRDEHGEARLGPVREGALELGALPKRWIVKRTIAWLNRCRRLAKDWENLNRNAFAFLKLASSASCCESSVI